MARFKKLLAPALVALLGATQAHAAADSFDPTLMKLMGVYGPHSAFAGPYVGAKFGINLSNITGPNARGWHSTWFPGIVAGVNYDVARLVVGVEGFADFHGGSSTRDDGGFDVKIGMPINGNLMPYARVGYTGSWPDNRLHYGAGIEYKFAKNWSVAGEYTGDNSSYDNGHRRNHSVTAGVRYYFF
jgi:outer membrane immunogenic protein